MKISGKEYERIIGMMGTSIKVSTIGDDGIAYVLFYTTLEQWYLMTEFGGGKFTEKISGQFIVELETPRQRIQRETHQSMVTAEEKRSYE